MWQRSGSGIRSRSAGSLNSGKMSELISPARGNGRSQILLEIAEKEKRRFRSELFAHEEQRWGRGKQEDRRRRANGTGIRNWVIRSPNARFPI